MDIDFKQLDRIDRQEAAEKLLAGETFILEDISNYKPDNFSEDGSAWSYLEKLNGKNVANLTPSQMARVKAALSKALDVPALMPSRSQMGLTTAESEDAVTYTPEEALRDLEAIRMGQPVPRLMQNLSGNLSESLLLIHQRIKQPMPMTRFITGKMGEGKTTLRQLVETEARAAGALPVSYIAPQSKVFRSEDLIGNLLLDAAIWHACGEHIQANDNLDERAALYSIADMDSSGDALRAFIHACEKPETNLNDEALTFTDAYRRWLQPVSYSRCTPLREYVSQHRESSPRIPSSCSPLALPSIIKMLIAFIRKCRVYPLWLLDEFESYGALGESRLQICLGTFRELVDAINEPCHESISTGGLIIFSTPDGTTLIKNYNALEDRLLTPPGHRFSPTHASWAMYNFRDWDPESVVKELLNIVKVAAQSGDITCNRIMDHASDLEEEDNKRALLQLISKDAGVPRACLKKVLHIMEEVGTPDFARSIQSHIITPPLSKELSAEEGYTPEIGQENTASRRRRSVLDLLNGGTEKRRTKDLIKSSTDPSPKTAEETDTLDPIPTLSERVRGENEISPTMEEDEAPKTKNRFKRIKDAFGALQLQISTPNKNKSTLKPNGKVTKDEWITFQKKYSERRGVPPLAEKGNIEEKMLSAANLVSLSKHVSNYREMGASFTEFVAIAYKHESYSDESALGKHSVGLMINNQETRGIVKEIMDQMFNRYRDRSLTLDRSRTRPVRMNYQNNSLNTLDCCYEFSSHQSTSQPMTSDRDSHTESVSSCIEVRATEIKTLDKYIFENIGEIRHALYQLAAVKGVIPDDDTADSLTMSYASFLGYEPVESRKGVFFCKRNGWDTGKNYKRYAETPLPHEPDPNETPF